MDCVKIYYKRKIMETKIVKVDRKHPQADIMREAGRILKDGGLVAFPTETVYGLGGNALDVNASHKIYAAKGRPSDNPLIIHIADMEDLPVLVTEIPPEAKRLTDAYWPGPLTMIFPKSECVPYETTGGLDSVAVRMPNHSVAQILIRGGRRLCGRAQHKHIGETQPYAGRARDRRSEREDRYDY